MDDELRAYLEAMEQRLLDALSCERLLNEIAAQRQDLQNTRPERGQNGASRS